MPESPESEMLAVDKTGECSAIHTAEAPPCGPTAQETTEAQQRLVATLFPLHDAAEAPHYTSTV